MSNQTLDPSDWAAFRTLGHRMVDDMIAFLASLHDAPAWRAMPPGARATFTSAVPLDPEGAEAAYEEFLRDVLPYSNANHHPRFWGWVQGTGTPLGMMADMLASGLNAHLAGFDQAPAEVEHQVLRWFTELMGMPKETSGVLATGGTMANILGLTVARHAKAGFDIRREGLQGDKHQKLVFYGSSECHSWAQKGAELLGLGSESLRLIPVDTSYQISLPKLRAAISADRQAGLRPFCVIGTAGTVNTAATDDLTALADLCREEQLWFHVDGAFGALARLSPRLAPLVAGMERADSLAFDLHKWMYLPFEIACILVRDPELHRQTFAVQAAYLSRTSRGVVAGGMPFADRGIELTRSFRALKVWLSLKAHGLRQFVAIIEQNVEHARRLGELISRHPDLELLTPVSLNIVCFRYAPKGRPDDQLNAANEEILLRIQEAGIAVPSGTVLNGRYAIRVAITNHRSRWEDFETLVNAVTKTGAAL
ncbi:MAG TPA: pyridoxal-dependent decarboxylase [Gemmatimonadales bacterium]|nr:pyridoxal-dependent decarboxylase [Gemmatimonadales bacterium]